MGKRIDDNFQPTETGEQLAGWLVDAMTVTGTRYGDVDVAVIRQEHTDLKYGVWLNRIALQRQFEKLRPRLGAIVVVTYKGLLKSKSTGRSYNAYDVRVGESYASDGRDWIEQVRWDLDKEKHQ